MLHSATLFECSGSVEAMCRVLNVMAELMVLTDYTFCVSQVDTQGTINCH